MCRATNHLRQMAMATHNFEAANEVFPASWKAARNNGTGAVDGWSIQAQILPYLEQANLYDQIDFSLSYTAQANINIAGTSAPLPSTRIATYLCPSEVNDQLRLKNGQPYHYPLSYAANAGSWFVYDPGSSRTGSGAITTNRELRTSLITDGLSNTILFSEVKAYTPYFRNAQIAGELAIPSSPAELAGLGGDFKSNTGHTEWVDGRVHQTAFTSTFRPNTVVPYDDGNQLYDVDWNNQQEGKSDSIKTFAAVTSRSYHPGGVNTARADGSVQFVSSSIGLAAWQALSTRDGGEVISD